MIIFQYFIFQFIFIHFIPNLIVSKIKSQDDLNDCFIRLPPFKATRLPVFAVLSRRQSGTAISEQHQLGRKQKSLQPPLKSVFVFFRFLFCFNLFSKQNVLSPLIKTGLRLFQITLKSGFCGRRRGSKAETARWRQQSRNSEVATASRNGKVATASRNGKVAAASRNGKVAAASRIVR
ncbi:hypothetical protein C7391_0187 [Methanimicrococcus blatticola]|uniref:Uncharacterized protein n=1 Tax=Methanimicrococcus blatticola TaxID=91560 RepID=A0A484F6V1_9EURY|nr:hypothetical protein C7391_0187 [Methanimicrococcus blatticola]